jgi:integrase
VARTPKPWFREDRQAYFVTVGGVRHNLGPDRKEAERRFHELMARRDDPPTQPHTKSPPPAGLAVAEVFDKYLDWCQRHRSARTYEFYRDRVQSFCDHLGAAAKLPAADLKPFHVAEWVDSKPTWGANQRRGAVVAATRPFNWAARLGYIPASPVRGVEKPAAERRKSTLTAADFPVLLSHVKDSAFRDLLVFGYEAGVRPQEARRVEARHCRLDLHRLEIPPAEAKGKRRWRVVYLSDAAAAILARLVPLRPDGPLFLNTDGRPWTAQAVVCRFQRLLVKMTGAGAGLPPTPRFDRRKYPDPGELVAARQAYKEKLAALRRRRAAEARRSPRRFAMYDLRHLFATRKLKEGHDPITVAALLGHRDAAMLCKHYEELSRDGEHLRRAANGPAG